MNRTRKLILASAATAAIVLGGTAMAPGAKAAEGTATSPMSSLISKLAARFNLQEADVKAVFDEQKTEMDAQRDQKNEERLAQAVTDGHITEAQKTLILEKRKELETKREETRANGDETADKKTMREAIRTEREELKAWAEENDIDMKWLAPFGGRGHGGPGFGGGMRGEMKATTSAN